MCSFKLIKLNKAKVIFVESRNAEGQVVIDFGRMERAQQFREMERECGREVKKRLQAGWNGWGSVRCDV